MDPESSLQLLQLAQAGDSDALDRLVRRYLPRLRRWTTGRLPRFARTMADTDDVVQDALIRTIRGLDGFENRGEWALQAYLRQAVMNRIRDEIRRANRIPPHEELTSQTADSESSPFEEAVGREAFARYQHALTCLDPAMREAVIARLELGCSFREIALLLDKPTADAARMAVSRALAKVALVMSEHV